MPTLVIGNKNLSSWSLRPWLLMRHFDLAFDEESLQDLTTSIEAVGVLQPIVVRPSGDRYQIVMGERRVRAARAAGLERIPAIVRTTEDYQLLRDALLENVHREDLNPLEEAAAYKQLLADFGITQQELASRLGRSRPVCSSSWCADTPCRAVDTCPP